MFYFLIPTLFSYNYLLVAAAVIPALFLMVKVYQSDRLERESPAVLWSLARAGILSALLALVEERVLMAVLNSLLPATSPLYNIILYFGIVAFAEESSKYLLLRRSSWSSREFNCQYDGVVYAVFVSLGFALWENISYVLHYGLGTAILRALTAIPGHACFGVFMGVFYGIAKRCDYRGEAEMSRFYRVLAVLCPALLHGTYDYIASVDVSTWVFVGFVALLFLLSWRLVGKSARNDRYI